MELVNKNHNLSPWPIDYIKQRYHCYKEWHRLFVFGFPCLLIYTLQKASWPEWGYVEHTHGVTCRYNATLHFLYTPDLDENMNMK